MQRTDEPINLSEVVDSEAFIAESIKIFFDPLGEFESSDLEGVYG
jgi:hypothetical protein